VKCFDQTRAVDGVDLGASSGSVPATASRADQAAREFRALGDATLHAGSFCVKRRLAS
jgi:hypothetical protein